MQDETAHLSSPVTELPALEKVIAALKTGHHILGPDAVDLAAAAWLERLSSHAQCAWRPIETAPKDRSRILLWQANRGAFEGWWHDGWPWPESYWMDDADSEPEPTHWRPLLPAPSTVTSTDGGGA